MDINNQRFHFHGYEYSATYIRIDYVSQISHFTIGMTRNEAEVLIERLQRFISFGDTRSSQQSFS